jgi:hypothetical protein
MHLDDERIQRVLHGELDAASKAETLEHAAACPECAARLAEARLEERWLFDALRSLDTAPPSVEPRALAARARTRSVAWGRLAASVALALGAAAVAYTAPGSPVPRWIERATGWTARPSPTAPAPVAPAPPVTAGISVAPGERFTIAFESRQVSGRVTVLPSDGSDVVTRVTGGQATFATSAGRLTIRNAGSTADYEIELPRSASWVEITAAGERLLLLQSGRVVSEAATGADDRRILSLSARP